MSFILLKNISADSIIELLEDAGLYAEFIEIDTFYNSEKIEFLLENIEKIDIDKLKSLV